MNIDIAGFTTSVGALFHKAAALAAKVEASIHAVVVEADKAAPMVEAVLGAINPGYGAAAKIIQDMIDAADAAIQAAGEQSAGGVTVALPAQLVADFQTAKTQIMAGAQHLK